MKKVIVLSALLLTASLTLTSCWNTTKEPETTDKVTDSIPQTEPAGAPADAAVQTQADSASTVAPDSIAPKK